MRVGSLYVTHVSTDLQLLYFSVVNYSLGRIPKTDLGHIKQPGTAKAGAYSKSKMRSYSVVGFGQT